MDNARLELQQGQDSGRTVITRLNGKLSLETVNSFIQTMRKELAQHLVLDERRCVPGFIGSWRDRRVASVGAFEVDSRLSDGGSGGQRARVRLAGRPGGMAGE